MFMKAKRKRQPTSNDNGVEIISLRDPQALLLANDRMNEDYGDGYVAYLDQRRGMKLYRRIIAHSADPLAVNEAIRKLPIPEQRKITLHYAAKPADFIRAR